MVESKPETQTSNLDNQALIFILVSGRVQSQERQKIKAGRKSTICNTSKKRSLLSTHTLYIQYNFAVVAVAAAVVVDVAVVAVVVVAVAAAVVAAGIVIVNVVLENEIENDSNKFFLIVFS